MRESDYDTKNKKCENIERLYTGSWFRQWREGYDGNDDIDLPRDAIYEYGKVLLVV